MQETYILDPIYDENSQILILGSFPSIKSRENHFYYEHYSNRFWTILEKIYKTSFISNQDKINFLHKNHIALWNVVKSCTIHKSSDQTIKDVNVNDIASLISHTHIHTIYSNGKKSYELYQKYCAPYTHINAICLPSTSLANTAYSLEDLVEKWKIMLKCDIY